MRDVANTPDFSGLEGCFHCDTGESIGFIWCNISFEKQFNEEQLFVTDTITSFTLSIQLLPINLS